MSDEQVDPTKVVLADAARQVADLRARLTERLYGDRSGFPRSDATYDAHEGLQHLRDAELRFAAAADPVRMV